MKTIPSSEVVRPVTDLKVTPVTELLHGPLVTERLQIPPLSDKWKNFDPRKWGCTITVNPTIPQFLSVLKSPVWIIDIETDGSPEQVIFGVGISSDDKQLFWFDDFDTVEWRTVIRHMVKVKIAGHRILWDIEQLRKYGVPMRDEQIYWDTHLGSATEDPTKDTHGLKDIAEKELGLAWPHYDEMTKRKYTVLTKKGKEVTKTVEANLRVIYAHHPQEVINYNATDLVAPYRLMLKQRAALQGNRLRLFEQMELPTAIIVKAMKEKGLRVDRDGLKKKETEYASKEETLRAYLVKETNDADFNPGSPKQVLNFLRERGHRITSTGEGILQPLTGNDAWVKSLLEFRGVNKLLGTYLRPLIEHSAQDGRIHTNFNQIARMANGKERPIITGRFSSSDPINLQNQPPEIREFFIPANGYGFVCADYSQIDLRSLAHLSMEPVYRDAFLKGQKVHQAVADKFGVEYKLGKIFSLALAYNGRAGRLMQEAEKWGYALSYPLCEKYAKAFVTELSTLTKWKKAEYEKAKRLGGVFTLFGRWIPLRYPSEADIAENPYVLTHWENCVIAFQGQGGTADIVKGGMIRLWKKGIVANAQVHDELLIEFPEDELQDRAKQVQYELEHVTTLRVPLVAEVGIGRTWKEAKPA